MSGSAWDGEAIVPAQLSFLTIYNPSLGRTDETLHDQVVYYYSSKSSRTCRLQKASDGDSASREHEELNERLRQIGLAQGMVEFARAFSDGENMDSVDSEKSRTLLHEVESGWWLLASIDLTRLQSIPEYGSSYSTSKKPKTIVEYSSREVCPQPLLLQHLLRAHAIFLLHHAPSLADLYDRLTRQKFCGALERFWNRFVLDWDVLLHGNPAVDIYNGLKLAAGGELGIGVGEEEWGSGEREVLEGFIGRTTGLVDVVVSRFGQAPEECDAASMSTSVRAKDDKQSDQQWLATGALTKSSDGVIFSGIGNVTRTSIRNVSAWMEWLYRHGHAAYGVQDSPHSARRKKRRKADNNSAIGSTKSAGTARPMDLRKTSVDSHYTGPVAEQRVYSSNHTITPGIPPPIVVAAERSHDTPSSSSSVQNPRSWSPGKTQPPTLGTDTIMKYMTLGIYGSSWGLPAGRPSTQKRNSSPQAQGRGTDKPRSQAGTTALTEVEQKGDTSSDPDQATAQGTFMIGLHGDLDSEEVNEEDENGHEIPVDQETGLEHDMWNSRVSVRTCHIERCRRASEDVDRPMDPYYDRLRMVVYVRQPFIFTFLFELQTDSLSMTSFYRSIHHQLGPLQRPLLASTAPDKVFERLWDAADPKSTTAVNSAQPIYDLVYDPSNLTVHTTIPGVPDSGTPAAEGLDPSVAPWTRIEALNVHSQILNTYISTRRHISELERTCKTSRGWWVVWMRLPRAPLSQQLGADSFREAFLIRKASDYIAPTARKRSTRFGLGSSESSAWGPAKLAEGIGIDTRRYIEGLLSLNR